MKESWKTINELLSKRSKSSNTDSLKESGSETVHRKDIPDAMNSYFCSVGKDLADKISPLAIPSYRVTLKRIKLKQSSISGQLRCRKAEIIFLYHLKILKYTETKTTVTRIHN